MRYLLLVILQRLQSCDQKHRSISCNDCRVSSTQQDLRPTATNMLSARDCRSMRLATLVAAIVCDEMPHYHNRIVKEQGESFMTLNSFVPFGKSPVYRTF